MVRSGILADVAVNWLSSFQPIMFSLSGRNAAKGNQSDSSQYFAHGDISDQVPLVGLGTAQQTVAPPNDSTRYESYQDRQHGSKLSVGSPKCKHHIELLDLAALSISIVCSILAVVTVANNGVAWSLRLNNQLKVIGFLLSIMNLCLGRAMPFLLVLLEARFGRSTLQNYDGILLNQFLKARLGLQWRVVIVTMLALPLGLSVAYKTFDGGSSSWTIDATEETGGMPALYGLFPVPGVYAVRGNNMGLSIYANASIPFRMASSPTDPTDPSSPEPPLPTRYPTAFGANTLILSDKSTAMLDMPWSQRLTALQRKLSPGDTLYISANVYGTVAECNTAFTAAEDPDFRSIFFSAPDISLYYHDMYNLNWVVLVARFGLSDQSKLWYGLVPKQGPGDQGEVTRENADYWSPYLKRYDITRRACTAVWNVTRGNIVLSDGSCQDGPLPGVDNQTIVTHNTLFLGERWLSIAAEATGIYSFEARKGSQWKQMSLTTFVAGMLWSAIVGLNGIGKTDDVPNPITGGGGQGILYNIPETIISTRETLKRSNALYAVLIVQPVLMLLVLIASAMLYPVPLDHGFGMVSIMAGVDHDSLDILQGASLSGQVKKDVHLSIVPKHGETKSSIRYEVDVGGKLEPNGKVRRRVQYS